jgi:thiol:disulfide interchange protein DsbD
MPVMRRAFLAIAATSLLVGAGAALAKPYWMRGGVANASEFLPPDEAFRLAAQVEGNLLRIRWVIADGYYLYRSRIEVHAESPDLVVEAPVLPPGSKLTDSFFGTQDIYRQQVEATVAYHQLDYGAHPIQVRVSYQGCAQAGLCYPLMTKVIFPEPMAAEPRPASSGWEPVAIIGGFATFLLAGLRLRGRRRSDTVL